MMAVSGLSQMKDYTSVETLEITQNLINAPKQCPCGHGLMVLLRVPCLPLAAVAYERLAHVRARLALEEHFEIILGSPSSGITVGKHFVKQLKVGAGGRSGRGATASGCLSCPVPAYWTELLINVAPQCFVLLFFFFF